MVKIFGDTTVLKSISGSVTLYINEFTHNALLQMVDKNVVQIQEAIKELEQGNPSRAVKDDIRKAVLVVKEAHRSTQVSLKTV